MKLPFNPKALFKTVAKYLSTFAAGAAVYNLVPFGHQKVAITTNYNYCAPNTNIPSPRSNVIEKIEEPNNKLLSVEETPKVIETPKEELDKNEIKNKPGVKKSRSRRSAKRRRNRKARIKNLALTKEIN